MKNALLLEQNALDHVCYKLESGVRVTATHRKISLSGELNVSRVQVKSLNTKKISTFSNLIYRAYFIYYFDFPSFIQLDFLLTNTQKMFWSVKKIYDKLDSYFWNWLLDLASLRQITISSKEFDVFLKMLLDIKLVYNEKVIAIL